MCNKAVLDIINKWKVTMIFKPEENVRNYRFEITGYYKIKQGIPQQSLSRYYRF